jgi:hypothetical protein
MDQPKPLDRSQLMWTRLAAIFGCFSAAVAFLTYLSKDPIPVRIVDAGPMVPQAQAAEAFPRAMPAPSETQAEYPVADRLRGSASSPATTEDRLPAVAAAQQQSAVRTKAAPLPLRRQTAQHPHIGAQAPQPLPPAAEAPEPVPVRGAALEFPHVAQ